LILLEEKGILIEEVPYKPHNVFEENYYVSSVKAYKSNICSRKMKDICYPSTFQVLASVTSRG